MNATLHGALGAGFLVCALFFARFWRDTRDAFFALFTASFLCMAVEEFARIALGAIGENDVRAFVLRLVSYGLILIAIAHKNRG